MRKRGQNKGGHFPFTLVISLGFMKRKRRQNRGGHLTSPMVISLVFMGRERDEDEEAIWKSISPSS